VSGDRDRTVAVADGGSVSASAYYQRAPGKLSARSIDDERLL
jgi:hypothetical protein